MKTFFCAYYSSLAFSLVEKRFIFQHGGPEAPPPVSERLENKPEASRKPDEVKAETVERKLDEKQKTKKRLDHTKKGLERDAVFKSVYRREAFETGKAEMTKEDLAKLSNIDQSLDYRVVGGVDSSKFDSHAEHDAAWYQEKIALAKQFIDLYVNGKLNVEFIPEDFEGTLRAMDELVRMPEKANPSEMKAKLDKLDQDSVYGSKGAYNFLLALKRANLVVPADKKMKVLYDLKVGRGVAPKARFTELGVKKEVPVKAPASQKAVLPPQTKMPEKPKESLEDVAAAAEKVVEAAAAEYREKYKFPITVIKGKDQLGNPVFTMSIDVGDGAKQSVHLRVVRDAEGIRYSLMDRPVRNSPMFPTLKDGEQAFRVAAEKMLNAHRKSHDTAREKVDENVAARLDAFFGSEQYLYVHNASITSDKIIKPQRIGGENGVDFSDAQYVFYKKGGEIIYVYSNPAEKKVSLYVTSTESSDQSKLVKLSLGDVSFGDLGSQVDKDAFATKLLKYADARPLRPSKPKIDWDI